MESIAWKRSVVEMVRVLQQMSQLDTEHLWEYHLPEVAATAAYIEKVEHSLEERLDSHHRAFLEVAGGWRGFYQRVDLFGPRDFLGSDQFRHAQELLSYLEDSVLVDSGFERGDLLPIACSSVNIDLFVIARTSAAAPGTVIWFEGVEIDRYPTFDDFFLAMIEYNRREVAFLATGTWPPT